MDSMDKSDDSKDRVEDENVPPHRYFSYYSVVEDLNHAVKLPFSLSIYRYSDGLGMFFYNFFF